MKNVLVIVHLLRATPRVEGLIRHLSEFGWEPVILTGSTSRHIDLAARIVETPYRDALGFLGRLLKINPGSDAGQQMQNRLGVNSKKSLLGFLMTAGGAIINYPCPDKNWKPFALRAARNLMEKERIDAIISTSAPLIGHIIANKLKTEYGLPWIADLRDLWSQNHNYRYGTLRRMLDRRLEIKTLKKADAITTVSEPWADKLRMLHKEKKVYTIVHGFNPAEVNDPPARLTDKFTITYTGNIYPGKQSPSRFFASLRASLSDGTLDENDTEVRFFGPVEGWLDTEIKRYGLSGIVKQYGQIQREVSVAKQRESQVLLFLDWDDPQEKGLYSGKIFEYLGARRPILATGGSRGDVVEGLLNETGAGIPAFTEIDTKNTLKELYSEYKIKGETSFNGEEAIINKYTHRVMAGRFTEILNNLIER